MDLGPRRECCDDDARETSAGADVDDRRLVTCQFGDQLSVGPAIGEKPLYVAQALVGEEIE